MSALIGWARVSTQEQSLDIQLDQLTKAGCRKIFAAKHGGASRENETALNELLDYVREDDTVVVTKLDRLGRSVRQVVNTFETLREKGCHLMTIEQSIDTRVSDNYMSKAMLTMMAMFAEMERSFIVERTQAGRIASGNKGGRPPKLDDDQRKQIIAAFAKGESKNRLSQKYGVSRLTIKRIVEA